MAQGAAVLGVVVIVIVSEGGDLRADHRADHQEDEEPLGPNSGFGPHLVFSITKQKEGPIGPSFWCRGKVRMSYLGKVEMSC